MKIALISDTHDHVDRLSRALEVFAEAGAEAMIHAGDMVAPFTAERLVDFAGPIRVVFGNCDGERKGLARVIKSIAQPPIAFELGGRRFVLAHSLTQISNDMLGKAEAAVVGHAHKAEQRHEGQTLIVNPGECCGRVSGRATVALLDSADLSVEVITL